MTRYNMIAINYAKAVQGLAGLYEIKQVEIYDPTLETAVRNYYTNKGYTEVTKEQVDTIQVWEKTLVGYINN